MLKSLVFISYSREDLEFVDRLAQQLLNSDVLVWLDRWEIRVGESFLDRLQEGIEDSSNLIIVLSPNSVSSHWVREELNMGLMRQFEEQNVYVLPVLISDCDIPWILRSRQYADFRNDFSSGFQELLRSIRPPDIGLISSDDDGDYHMDYRIENLEFNGLFGIEIQIVHHSHLLGYSILTTINIWANDVFSRRLTEYINAGYLWAVYDFLLGIAQESGMAQENDGMLIQGDNRTEIQFGSVDPNRDTETRVVIESRRLGYDPGQDILFGWRNALNICCENQRNKSLRTIPESERQSFLRWLRENPF